MIRIASALLAMCMSCQLFPPQRLEHANEKDFYGELENYLVGFSNKPPLHIVAEFVHKLEANEVGKAIFDAYDQFLSILGDPTKRDHLENLTAENASSNQLLEEAREVGKAFQIGLTTLFFNTDTDLTEATQRYGVF